VLTDAVAQTEIERTVGMENLWCKCRNQAVSSKGYVQFSTKKTTRLAPNERIRTVESQFARDVGAEFGQNVDR